VLLARMGAAQLQSSTEAEANDKRPPFLELLGSRLIYCNNESISSADLVNYDVVGIFISAGWCGQCHSFSNTLKRVYNEVNRIPENKFEVVLCSLEKTEHSFNEHFSNMPWCAIPFNMKELRENVGISLWLRGVPKLILFDSSGEIITKNGKKVVLGSNAVSEFPWKNYQEI